MTGVAERAEVKLATASPGDDLEVIRRRVFM